MSLERCIIRINPNSHEEDPIPISKDYHKTELSKSIKTTLEQSNKPYNGYERANKELRKVLKRLNTETHFTSDIKM